MLTLLEFLKTEGKSIKIFGSLYQLGKPPLRGRDRRPPLHAKGKNKKT